MQIRLACLGDAEQIAQNNVFLAEESENVFVDYDTTLHGVEAVMVDKNKGFYLVAEENNVVVGQLMVTYEWSDWRNGMVWWIQSVYVKKEYRGRGVFKGLLKAVEEMAKKEDVKLLRLYVHSRNRNAVKVYEHVGMEKTSYLVYQKKVL